MATYRVTWAAGWKTIPWPFGLIEVGEDGLRLHSKYWSWWQSKVEIPKDSVNAVAVGWLAGAAHIRIRTSTRKRPVTVSSSVRQRALIADLRSCGYPVTEKRRPPDIYAWIRDKLRKG